MYICHCDSVYVRQTTQRLCQRIRQHVPRSFVAGTGKPQMTTAIGKHLEKNEKCRKNYNDERFSVITMARNKYHLGVLEALFIQTLNPILCVQKQFVYTTILFKMLK